MNVRGIINSLNSILQTGLKRLRTFKPGNGYVFYVIIFLTFFFNFSFFKLITTTVTGSYVTIAVSIIADSSFFSLLCMLFRGKFKIIALAIPLILSILIIINTIYFNYFDDLIPASLYSIPNPFNKAVVSGGLRAFKWYLLLPLVISLAPIIFVICISLKKFFHFDPNSTLWLAMGLLFLASESRLIYKAYQKEQPATTISAFYKHLIHPEEFDSDQRNWHSTYSRLNFSGYLWRCLVNGNNGIYIKLNSKDVNEIKNHLATNSSKNSINLQSGDKQHKTYINLIFIVVESLTSDALKTENAPLAAPFLTELMSSPDHIYIPAQVLTKYGHSSDAQLLYSTGLLPLRSEPFAVNYPYGDYPSLAKAFKGKSVEIIGEEKTLWNHDITNKSYGYDSLVSNVAPLGQLDQDSLIFKKAEDIIANSSSPFFLFITTLSMHEPYNKSAVTPNLDLSRLTEISSEEREYYQRLNHFDRNLRGFIKFLQERYLLENTLVVIAGDHETLGPENPEYLRTPYIPVLFLNVGAHKILNQNFTQADVFPTIIELLNITYKYKGVNYSGLGKSFFSERDKLPTEKDYKISEMIIKSNF